MSITQRRLHRDELCTAREALLKQAHEDALEEKYSFDVKIVIVKWSHDSRERTDKITHELEEMIRLNQGTVLSTVSESTR